MIIKKIISLISAISLILFQKTFAQTFFQPQHYVCYQAKGPVTIDGKADEAAWQQAAWTADFQDIEGDAKPQPPLRTRVKMLWDQQYLYIAATLQEPHIWGTLRERDAIIFHDNDFEIFIDPDGDTHQYYELEINALNTLMDLFMGKPYRNGGLAMLNWDAKGIRTAVHINGTLNDPSDTDKTWSVEMAIPFSALSFFGKDQLPAANSLWRINFSRVEWDTDIKNATYVKQRKPEHNWVWSPQGIINMHAPERWGYLLFAVAPHTVFRLPAEEEAKRFLWQMYYAQQQYRQANGRYAASLQALQVASLQNGAAGQVYHLEMEGISSQFNASVKGNSFAGTLNINQEGRVYNNRK